MLGAQRSGADFSTWHFAKVDGPGMIRRDSAWVWVVKILAGVGSMRCASERTKQVAWRCPCLQDIATSIGWQNALHVTTSWLSGEWAAILSHKRSSMQSEFTANGVPPGVLM